MKWITEKRWPFVIIEDPQFIFLMKTGHLGYCLPLAKTVARDIKHIFVEMCQRISKMLKVILTHLVLYPSHHPHPQKVDCMLNVAMDAWTSPNSHAFVTVTIHYEEGGNPRTLLLDIMECAEAHTGVTLAVTLVKIFNNFGISDKVWWIWKYKKKEKLILISCRSWPSHATMPWAMTRWSTNLLSNLMTSLDLWAECGVSHTSSI